MVKLVNGLVKEFENATNRNFELKISQQESQDIWQHY